MLTKIAGICRKGGLGAALAVLAGFAAAPASAQIQSIDPDSAIDGDLAQPQERSNDVPYRVDEPAPRYEQSPAQQVSELPPADSDYRAQAPSPAQAPVQAPPSAQTQAQVQPQPQAALPAQAAADRAAMQPSATYAEDDLIGAAEGLFGRGAEGLARLIEDILEKQGEPNGYIVGREGGGAFLLGVRYGSGTLFHKVEGNRPVYWTGPSIGFDAGANAGNTFVLVYNLHDTEELYERFPAGEGQAYLGGGFNASYVRKGNVVLIPIRVGAGLRLGVNAGYMKFSKKQRWLPF